MPMLVPVLPCNLPGRLLWLDASTSSTLTLSGSNVSQWNDKSGNGNNPLQATMSNQPTYSATGLNGRPAVVFSGNQFLRSEVPSLAQPYSLFIVTQYAGGGATLTVFDFGNNGTTQSDVFFTNDSTMGLYAGNYFTIGVPSFNTPRALAMVFNGSSSSMSVDGSLIGTVNPGTQSGTGFTVGATDYVESEFWVGPISEIIAITGAFTLNQQTQLHYYAQRKWGTP
jgi:hypothetical protein